MQEQIERKDEKIGELTLEVNRLQNVVHVGVLEGEGLKASVKALMEEL